MSCNKIAIVATGIAIVATGIAIVATGIAIVATGIATAKIVRTYRLTNTKSNIQHNKIMYYTNQTGYIKIIIVEYINYIICQVIV